MYTFLKRQKRKLHTLYWHGGTSAMLENKFFYFLHRTSFKQAHLSCVSHKEVCHLCVRHSQQNLKMESNIVQYMSTHKIVPLWYVGPLLWVCARRCDTTLIKSDAALETSRALCLTTWPHFLWRAWSIRIDTVPSARLTSAGNAAVAWVEYTNPGCDSLYFSFWSDRVGIY